MSGKIKIRLFLVIAIACWLMIAVWAMITHQQGSSVDPIYDTIHGDIYSSQMGISLNQEALPTDMENPQGVLLPHPENNGNSAGKAMATLASVSSPEALVVVAFAEDCGSVPLTGLWGWQTPYGVVTTDEGRVDAIKSLGAKTDNEKLGDCTALGNLMFYCSYYFEGVPVVPIVLDTSLSGSQISTVLTGYQSILEDTAIVVVAPKIAEETPLYSTDINTLNQKLRGMNTQDYSGIFPAEVGGALKAFGVLTASNGGIYTDTCLLQEGEVPNYFSELLIYSLP